MLGTVLFFLLQFLECERSPLAGGLGGLLVEVEDEEEGVGFWLTAWLTAWLTKIGLPPRDPAALRTSLSS